MMALQPRWAARLGIVVAIAVSLATGTAWAQVSATAIRSLGLERAWNTTIRVPVDGGGIVAVEMWLDPTHQRNYAVAELPDRTIQMPTDQLDESLQPIGAEAAMAIVRQQAARVTSSTDGVEVTERSISAIRLVAVSRDGLVQCLDAETGKPLWATPCGDTSAPTYSVALCRAGVSLVQGDTLYLLEWESGRELQRKVLPTGTTHAVAAIDVPIKPLRGGRTDATDANMPINSIAFTVDINGEVRGYSFTNPTTPWQYRVVGRSIAAPVSLPDRTRIAVPTDKGWLYVFSGGLNPTVEFRYETGSQLSGCLAAGVDAFYAGDSSGTFSKISTTDQRALMWSQDLPHGLTSKPLVDDASGLVFVATIAGDLIALDNSTGHAAWTFETSQGARIRGPICVVGEHLICRTYLGTLAAVDIRSGQLLSETPSQSLSETMITNNMTDRVYVLGPFGELQCLRGIGKSLPKISAAFAGGSAVPKKPTETQSPPPDSPSLDSERVETLEPANDGLGDDPFGGQPDQNDPFAEDNSGSP